jgi:putative tricarboxylic transport membrane protein
MTQGGQGKPALHQKSAEIIVSALFFVVGAIVIYDSLRLGMRWAEVHGPQPGYFPFYVGLIICVASLINLVSALLMRPEKNRGFVERGQLKLVLTVLVPTAIFAGAVAWIGIYVSSFLFIGFFMRWLGNYPWWKVAAVSLGAMAVIYLIFERWFLVPLPKGPLESLLGLG